MSTDAEEFTKKATEFRSSGRIDEAILAARKATTLDPEYANGWWQLALAIAQKDGHPAALFQFKKTVELSPSFSYGWFQLGKALQISDSLDEAEVALMEAIEADPEMTDALRLLVKIYKSRDADGDKTKLIEVLEKLDSLSSLSEYDTHTLAIAYYNKSENIKAISYYKKFLRTQRDPYGYFNIGLAYSQRDISQEIDAVDSWRMSLRLKPDYDRPEKSISNLLPKLLSLKNKVLELQRQKPLLSPGEWYKNYINPIELLNLGNVTTSSELDVKEIQLARKILLQEIELEDGVVSWMPNLIIDRSRAIQLVDELSNPENRYFHLLVYENKELLNFLSRGDLQHFLIDPVASPVQIIEKLDSQDIEFSTWLSSKLCKQFNIVFPKTIERREPLLIEAMLDGRRWVTPQDEDKCFEIATQQSFALLDEIRKISETSEVSKPSLNTVTTALEKSKTGEILTLLPSAFQNILNEAADLIRNISVTVNNHYHDPDLAKAILILAKDFAKRAPSVRMKIEKDAETLEGIIKKEKAHEKFIVFGEKKYNVTREGVSFNDKVLLVDEIETLRWGLTINRANGVETNEFSIVIGGPGAKVLSLSWKASQNIAKQRELFSSFVEAIMIYLLPSVVEKVSQKIKNGGTVFIGGIAVNKQGIILKSKGWFSEKDELCPWLSLNSEVSNGDLIITSKHNPKAKVSLTLGTIDNAWVLHWLLKDGF